MDFSSDWAKPGSVMTTGPLAKARLELARQATSQVTRRSFARDPLVPG